MKINKSFNHFIKPGYLEVVSGPMRSGKTREIINIVDKLAYMKDKSFLLIKPDTDTRDNEVASKFGNLNLACSFIDKNKPERILELVKDHSLVAIDEAQFFDLSLVKVIEKMIKDDIYVVVGGLDLDFRGEPFGPIPHLMAKANKVHKLAAVCQVCGQPATRNQRLINGKPAPYNAPLVSVEGSKEDESYEPRCLKHHKVPKTSQDSSLQTQ